MSRKFNLFLLRSSADIHPRSWICIKGLKLKNIVRELERDVLETTGNCRESLSKKLSTHFHCSHSVIKRVLQSKSEFYPIPLILKLLKLSKNRRKFLKKIKENVQYLKVNSASAKPVKAICRLNENLAKILGAFMADGSLSIQIVIAASRLKDLEKMKSKLTKLRIRYSTGYAPSRNQYYINIQANKNNFKSLNKAIHFSRFLVQTHYSIELTDEYKDNVEAFIKWIRDEFNIIPNRFKKRENAWRVSFSNKILARYLITFFEVKPGVKACTAFEPKIIKRSNLKIRKAFARGILMFDGCVTFDKKILFSVRSKDLLNSLGEIWGKDKIEFKKSKNSERREETLFTTAVNKKERLLKYFEENTQKWKLLKWLSGDLTKTPIFQHKASLSLKRILSLLQKIKCCDAIFLKNYFKCGHSIIRTYLKILKDQGKIRLSNRPDYISKYVDENTTVLLKSKFHNLIFKRMREKFKKDKNFAKFSDIHKATISAWRTRKSRMPLYALRKMCKILNIDFNKVSKNTSKTDREIAEIIQ